jgi:hypothetical protein
MYREADRKMILTTSKQPFVLVRVWAAAVKAAAILHPTTPTPPRVRVLRLMPKAGPELDCFDRLVLG